MRKFALVLFMLGILLGILLDFSNSSSAQFNFPWTVLKKNIESAVDCKIQYGRSGETWYLRVNLEEGMTLNEFCKKVPMLQKNMPYSVERIVNFSGIKDASLKLKILLIPVDATDPPKKTKFKRALIARGGAL